MNAKIEELRGWGCDVKGALERMAGDEEFYLECLNTIPEEPCFPGLEKALQERNVSQAFDCAHTLKGVLANLGLTPMFDKTVEIVEPLRAGKDEGLTGKMNELMEMKNHLAQILK